MALAYVQSVAASGGSDPNSVAFGSNVTANSIIVAVVRSSSGNGTDTADVTDTLGNTYSQAAQHISSSGTILIYWTQSASGGANTVEADTAGDVATRLAIHEFSADGTVSQGASSSASDGTAESATPGDVTPATADSVIFGAVGTNSDHTFTGAGTGFTLGPVASSRAVGGWRVLSSIEADGPAFSWTGSDGYGAVCVVFEETVGGGGGGLSVPIAMHHYKQLRAAS